MLIEDKVMSGQVSSLIISTDTPNHEGSGQFDGAVILVRAGVICLKRGCIFKCSYNPMSYYETNADLKKAIDQIKGGYFTPATPDMFVDIANHLLYHDT